MSFHYQFLPNLKAASVRHVKDVEFKLNTFSLKTVEGMQRRGQAACASFTAKGPF
jgi:hypothetical protein